MVKNKKIAFKHNELVGFITETITEMYVNKLINEQNLTYLNYKLDGPVMSYTGTKQDALKAWANTPEDVKKALKSQSVPIEPFSVLSHSYYNSLSPEIRTYLRGFLYPVNIKNESIRNQAVAAGESTYVFIPSTTKHINLPTVHICADKQTGKDIDCDSRLALDGTHEASGFEVSTSQVIAPSIFGYGDDAVMNTKYFCKQYLVGDIKTPENVKPKVLMHLQQAWSKKTGENLGVNSSKGPEYYYGGSNITEKLTGYENYDILKMVSQHIDKTIDKQKADYKAGTWRYMVGSKLNPESAAPLSDEQHKQYFKEMKNFAAMLLKTNCGYGVGKNTLSAAEKQVREKYGDIFAFQKEKPDNWGEMSEEDKKQWLKENESKLEKKTTLEKQNDTQFWWDMFSVAILVVAVVITVASAGTLAPVAAGLVYLSAGMGVASGIFDMWQGEWGWGVMGLTLEILPFWKVIKMSKYLKGVKISPEKMSEMVEFGMKNGKEALKPKYGKSGKALFDALTNNADDLVKILDANTKESVNFLKRFSTMDPSEFYLLQQLNKGFKTSMKGTSFAKFDQGVKEMANILFANRTAWKTFVGKARFSLSLPLKMIGLNLAAMTIVNSVRCFDMEVNITGKKLLRLAQLTTLYPAGAVIKGLGMIEITLDTERVQKETMCTLFALIYANASSEDLKNLEVDLNEVVDGNVKVIKEGNNVKITIEHLNGEGGTDETTVLDIENVVDDITEVLDSRAELEYKAWIESYTDDEEILEYWLLELGGDEVGAMRLNELMMLVNANDVESMDILWDLVADTDKIFNRKKQEIEQRRIQKQNEYGL